MSRLEFPSDVLVGTNLLVGSASANMTSRPNFANLPPAEQAERLARHTRNQDFVHLTGDGIWLGDGVATSVESDTNVTDGAAAIVTTKFAEFMRLHNSRAERPEAVVEMAHEAAAHADLQLARRLTVEAVGSTTLTALLATNDPRSWALWITGDSPYAQGRGGQVQLVGIRQTVTEQDPTNGMQSYVTNTFAGRGRPGTYNVPARYAAQANLFVDLCGVVELTQGDTAILYSDGLDGGTRAHWEAGEHLDPSIILQEADRHPSATAAAHALITLPERLEAASQTLPDPADRFISRVDDISAAVGRVIA